MKAKAKQDRKQEVAYYRVSTTKQGINGLGMDAQRAAVENFLHTGKHELLAEFKEVESGKRKDRPELDKAIALCRKSKATLLIAKLDRLARNAAFVLNLRDSGVDFVACDMPDANKLTIGIIALMAEHERDLISERTKAGLAAAKRRGVKLGSPRIRQVQRQGTRANRQRADTFAHSLKRVIVQIRKAGVQTLAGIAECLNARGYKTPRNAKWCATAVARLLERIES